MKLASAFPNKEYRWYGNLADIHLEAHFTGEKIVFYEVQNGKMRRIPERIIRDLFPEDGWKRYRPFMESGNESFFAILHRHRKQYKPIFKQLIWENLDDENI